MELPPALDEAEASSSQPTESRALALEELLTRREAEIARFVAEGLSNKQIARKATISEATVKITQGLQKARHRKSQHARRYGQLGAGASTRTVMRPLRHTGQPHRLPDWTPDPSGYSETPGTSRRFAPCWIAISSASGSKTGREPSVLT